MRNQTSVPFLITAKLGSTFLAWDGDDLLLTSLNWGSAVGDADFPYGEVGVHIKAPGIADLAMDGLQAVLPDLFPGLSVCNPPNVLSNRFFHQQFVRPQVRPPTAYLGPLSVQ